MMEELLLRYGWIAAIATNLLIGWVGWSLTQKFVTRDDHAKAVAPLTARLAELEIKHGSAPSHQDLTRVHERLDAVLNKLEESNVIAAELKGTLGGVRELTKLLTEHHLERGR